MRLEDDDRTIDCIVRMILGRDVRATEDPPTEAVRAYRRGTASPEQRRRVRRALLVSRRFRTMYLASVDAATSSEEDTSGPDKAGD